MIKSVVLILYQYVSAIVTWNTKCLGMFTVHHLAPTIYIAHHTTTSKDQPKLGVLLMNVYHEATQTKTCLIWLQPHCTIKRSRTFVDTGNNLQVGFLSVMEEPPNKAGNSRSFSWKKRMTRTILCSLQKFASINPQAAGFNLFWLTLKCPSNLPWNTIRSQAASWLRGFRTTGMTEHGNGESV